LNYARERGFVGLGSALPAIIAKLLCHCNVGELLASGAFETNRARGAH